MATAGSIVHLGAKPIFADVGQDLNLDPSSIEKLITKLKLIIPSIGRRIVIWIKLKNCKKQSFNYRRCCARMGSIIKVSMLVILVK